MSDTPTPLDLDAIRACRSSVGYLGNGLADEIDALLDEVERLRAEVAMTARPAPAWDEEAVAEAVRKDLEAAGILPWTNGGARIVRTALAVVREHLPAALPFLTAAPSATRDEVARAIRSVTDRWDEPLDEVHDVPPVADALLARFNMTPKEDR